MADRIALNDLWFGEIDAKDEILSRSEDVREFFQNSYLLPPKSVLRDLETGRKYIVCGPKGAGKTALLRVLYGYAKRDGDPAKFVVFSKDVSDPERQHVYQMSGVDVVSAPEDEVDHEVVLVWELFIFRKFADLLSENISHCQYTKLFCALIKEVYDKEPDTWFSKLSSILKSGKIEISADLVAKLKVSAELEFSNDKSFRIHVFCQKLEEILNFIDFPKDTKFKVFIDEINLSLVSKKKHKRDSILIRDLIICVNKLNGMFSEENLPLFVYLAVRSEIVSPRNMAKHEVQKSLASGSVDMKWYSGKNVNNFRIFNLITKKIQASEARKLKKVNGDKEIWDIYFAKDIFGVDPKVFIAEITWCNPRDTVVLLGEVSDTAEGLNRNAKIDTHTMRRGLERYSKLMWDERSEELNVKYAITEINSIKKILSGFSSVFKVGFIEGHAERLAEKDQKIMQLLRTKNIVTILEDLYYIGVIGQSYTHSRVIEDAEKNTSINEKWFYRDFKDFDQNAWCVVHRGVRTELSLGAFHAKDFQNVSTYID